MRRILVLIAASVSLLGCSLGEPEVRLDTPEETGRSVGRVLCAEHQQRVEAIDARLEAALVLQAAKGRYLGAAANLDAVNERLERFNDFFKKNFRRLRECEVVLVDKMISEESGQVYLAIAVRFKDWSGRERGAADDSPLELVDRTWPVTLTLSKIEEEWRVTESSRALALPGGALRSLLD